MKQQAMLGDLMVKTCPAELNGAFNQQPLASANLQAYECKEITLQTTGIILEANYSPVEFTSEDIAPAAS